MAAKIAILTDFYGFDEAYSLCRVVDEQLRMIPYKKVLIVDNAFPQSGTAWHRDDIEIRRIPGVPRGNEIKIDATWDQDIEALRSALESDVSDIDVIISHDLVFQPAQLKLHKAALLVAAAHPEKKWLHWIHSATSSFVHEHRRIAGGWFPNAKIVFPNAADAPRIAACYGISENDVALVPHATDPLTFLMDNPLSRALAEEIDLLDADVIGCYPARLDAGKQVEVGIEIFHQIKQTGRKIRYIIFDFHSTGGDKVIIRNRLLVLCQSLNLEVGKEVVFTSQWRKETNLECPRQMVRDIMLVSDVLIQPSRSETYSLIAQEAALCRNLLMLNFDHIPIKDIYGCDALYGKFSSNLDALTGMDGTTETQYSNRSAYMAEQAKRIIGQLMNSMVLRQFRFRRKNRSLKAVWTNYLEPLLYG